MTNTDRAFIAAYQQSAIALPVAETGAVDAVAIGEVAAEAEAQPTASVGSVGGPVGGPHFKRKKPILGRKATSSEKPYDAKSARRAPLSELLAERRELLANRSSALAVPPAFELNAFRWPDTSTRLARQHGSALIAALASVPGNVVTLVGATSGVGLTTMALALAQATTRADLRVALVDANPVASDLAFQMGVRRLRTLAEAAEQGDTLENCIVNCRDDSTSLVIAGGPIAPEIARQSLDQLSAVNDLVIIDAGAITVPLSSWITASEGVCLVDQTDQERDNLLRSFAIRQIKVHGVIENFVTA